MKKLLMIIGAAVAVGAMALPTMAGSLLYSYDFDQINENGLVLADVNKGSGTGVDRKSVV